MGEMTIKCENCKGTGNVYDKTGKPYSYQCSACGGLGDFLTEVGKRIVEMVLNHGDFTRVFELYERKDSH